MSFKLYAAHLCILRIQNYNGVCTNGFLHPTNSLQPPKQVVDGWFIKETLKYKYTTYHTQKIYIKYINNKKEIHNYITY